MLKIEIGTIRTLNTIVMGTVLIPYKLSDSASRLVNLNFEFSINGGVSWEICNPDLGDPYHEPPANLTTSPAGTPHNFAWDTFTLPHTILPNRVIFRISSLLVYVNSNSPVSESYIVDNTHPNVTISKVTTVKSGEFEINYKLYSQDALTACIECYYSLDKGIEWKECQIDTDAVTNPTGNLSTGPLGIDHVVKWNSTDDVNAREVLFKIVPYLEGFPPEIGYEGISEPFFVDNHTEWFYKKVPYTFFALDTDDVLRYYMKILDLERQVQTDITTSMLNLLDPIKCPEPYVDLLAQALGVPVVADTPIDIKRRQIASAVLLYHQKGKKSAFYEFFLMLGYKVDVYEVTTDGADCDVDFFEGNWYKNARININFFKYRDNAWIEPWETDKLLLLLEEVRPIHDLVVSYNWGFDFTEFLFLDDDGANVERSKDLPDLLGEDWLNPPKEVIVFDTWFGDGVTKIFNNNIPFPGLFTSVLEGSVSISAIGVANEAMEGKDDGLGAITGNNVTSGINSTINYATGAISIEFDIAPYSGSEVTLMYSYIQNYQHYRPAVPHHLYKADSASLLQRSDGYATLHRISGVAASDEYIVPLTTQPELGCSVVSVYNIRNDELMLQAVEDFRGRLKSIYTKSNSLFWKRDLLGQTVAFQKIYNLFVITPPVPVVPDTPIITIAEFEIRCDYDGNLTGTGTIEGLANEIVTGTVDYTTGAVVFTLLNNPPLVAVDVYIDYQTYEFVFIGVGGAGLTNIPLALNCYPIEAGTIKFTNGVDIIASDNGLGSFEGAHVNTAASNINYATGIGNLQIDYSPVLNDYHGVEYSFTPIGLDSDLSKINRGFETTIVGQDGVNDRFAAPKAPSPPLPAPPVLSIRGQLLTPVPIVPASVILRCGASYGRTSSTGVIGGGVGMSGNIYFDSGAYNIVVTPAPTEPIHVFFECRNMFLKFDSVIDTTADYRIDIITDVPQLNLNYDQANSCEYNRRTLSMYNSVKDFQGREGYAEGIGVGDGITTAFVGTLVKFPGVTQIQPGSVTMLVWCDNVAKTPKNDSIPVQVCAHDDGVGNLNGVDDDQAAIWGTINYGTGAIVLNFGGASCIPTSGANIVFHYSDDSHPDSSIQELGWYGWKKKGSRLSILRSGIGLYYNG